MNTTYVVFKEISLGYTIDSEPKVGSLVSVWPLASKANYPDIFGGPFFSYESELRKATAEDFAKFRVVLPKSFKEAS